MSIFLEGTPYFVMTKVLTEIQMFLSGNDAVKRKVYDDLFRINFWKFHSQSRKIIYRSIEKLRVVLGKIIVFAAIANYLLSVSMEKLKNITTLLYINRQIRTGLKKYGKTR